MKACMGGWCRIRERCHHYAAAAPNVEPADRLCVPGHDGFGQEQAIRFYRPSGTWEKAHSGLLRKAQPFDLLGVAQ